MTSKLLGFRMFKSLGFSDCEAFRFGLPIPMLCFTMFRVRVEVLLHGIGRLGFLALI